MRKRERYRKYKEKINMERKQIQRRDYIKKSCHGEGITQRKDIRQEEICKRRNYIQEILYRKKIIRNRDYMRKNTT